MEIRYYHDPAADIPHIYLHGVSEDEVEEILETAEEEQDEEDGSIGLSGQTRAGRYLKVICRPDDDGNGLFIITSYTMSERAKQAFRRRRRRRRR